MNALPGAAAIPVVKGNTATQQSVSKGLRVHYAHFSAFYDARFVVTSPACPNEVRIAVDDAAAGVPVFYLPYQNNQNFRITLDATGPGAGAVDFFMTELVDGCSVYIEGTAQKPTAYHINAAGFADSGGSPTSLAGLATAAGLNLAGMSDGQKHHLKFGLKSAHMDLRFQNDAALRPQAVLAGGPGLLQARKVENDDYMLRPNSNEERAFGLTLPALQAVQKAPNQVNGKSVDRMEVVSTQGFIFGLRSGGAWKFYGQRKVLVEYFHRSNAVSAKLQQTFRGTARPLASLGMQWIVRDVIQFWPAAKLGSNA